MSLELLKEVTGYEEVVNADYIFVEQDMNWADEIDFTGYSVYSKEALEKELELLKTAKFPQTRGYGTNEDDDIESLEDYLYSWSLKPITKIEYDSFLSMFNDNEAGDFWMPDAYDDYDDEEE